jgi:hypothetical protein
MMYLSVYVVHIFAAISFLSASSKTFHPWHPTPFPFFRFRNRRSFGFDYRTLQRSKLMRDVVYEPLLRVPIAAADDDSDDGNGDANGEAVYALYAAVIHSGR